MTTAFGAYLQSNTYTAKQDRQLQNAQMLRRFVSGNPLVPRSGVLIQGSTGNLAVTGSGLMNLSVEAGCAMVLDFMCVVDGTTALVVQPSTATARRDLVVLRVYDTEQGDPSSYVALEVIKGTTTSDPAIPARSLVLAQVDVGANVTTIASAITDRRVWSTSVGGVLRTANLALDAPLCPRGTVLYESTTDKLYRTTATGYVQLTEMLPLPEMAHQRSGSQTLSNGWGKLTWSSIAYQSSTASGELSSNPSGIVAVKGGRYQCEGSMSWPAMTSGGRRGIGVGTVADTSPPAQIPLIYYQGVNNGGQPVSISGTYAFNAGDIITIHYYQDTGGAVVGDGASFRLNVRKLV